MPGTVASQLALSTAIRSHFNSRASGSSYGGGASLGVSRNGMKNTFKDHPVLLEKKPGRISRFLKKLAGLDPPAQPEHPAWKDYMRSTRAKRDHLLTRCHDFWAGYEVSQMTASEINATAAVIEEQEYNRGGKVYMFEGDVYKFLDKADVKGAEARERKIRESDPAHQAVLPEGRPRKDSAPRP